MASIEKNPISLLLETCKVLRIPTPEFEEIRRDGPSHLPHFHVRVTINGVESVGQGKTKQVAKAEAAKLALQRLSSVQQPTATSRPSSTPLQNTDSRTPASVLRATAGPVISSPVLPKYDVQRPLHSLNNLLRVLNKNAAELRVEQNPYIGCISVTAAVVDTSGRAPVLNISETALAFNEDDAVSTACYTVFDDILGRRAVRQYLEEASKTSSQQHQTAALHAVPAYSSVVLSSEGATAENAAKRPVPEYKRVLFHYKKIIQALQARGDQADICRLMPQMKDDVQALEALGRAWNFKVSYESFPQEGRRGNRRAIPGSQPSDLQESKCLRVCSIYFPEKQLKVPFFGSGESVAVADEEASKNAIKYLYFMETKIQHGLA